MELGEANRVTQAAGPSFFILSEFGRLLLPPGTHKLGSKE